MIFYYYMFVHQGNNRNQIQNIGIASLLSFVAGNVNVVGFLTVKQLTTNVTGHFAFMMEEALQANFNQTFFYFLYIFCFFLGAFFSNFIIETIYQLTKKYYFILPVLLEVILLTSIAFQNTTFIHTHYQFFSCLLLFTMGMQNSLVTTISNAVIRTTHLTGLFTDLGIEISQLFFQKISEKREKIIASIKLRLSIITFFFLGGLIAGIVYDKFNIKTLLIAAFVLVIGLSVDYFILNKKKYDFF